MKTIEKYNKILLLIELFAIFTVITLGIKYYFKPFIIIIIMHSLCLKNTIARRSYLRLPQCPKNSPKPRTFP